MTMTDPVADMLTRLRNASSAHHATVEMPFSKFKAQIASILKNEGFIADFSEAPARVGKTLTLTLKFGKDDAPAFNGIRRISKPGLRKYAKSDALPQVLGGLGIAIISSSAGLMTDKEAAKKNVGGEIVAYVW